MVLDNAEGFSIRRFVAVFAAGATGVTGSIFYAQNAKMPMLILPSQEQPLFSRTDGFHFFGLPVAHFFTVG
jgi:hypothetical protein